MRTSLRRLSLSALSLLLVSALRADEGMWTFDNLPLKQMKEIYGFTPDQAWLDHVRLSSISLGGCSASFVSADGLVITNHHCGRGSIQALSSKEKDYIKYGFLARTREEEIKVPNASWRTLMKMENVTDQVAKVVKPGMTEQQSAEARQKLLDGLRTELDKKDALTYQVVNLYQGGETWLYGFKTYRDIRLVAAPEQAIAFFGGDPDNFTYPRHNLDFCLFRVYEEGKPYSPPHHFKLSEGDLKIGDLTFIVGNPGRTLRLQTSAQTRLDRDFNVPNAIKTSERTREILLEYGARSPEHARQVGSLIFGVENGLKANRGALVGLKDADAMKRLEDAEKDLRTKVAKDTKLSAGTGPSWGRIEQALKQQTALALDARHVGAARSTTLGQALGLVRFFEQEALPADKRLAEFKTGPALKAARERLAQTPRGMMGATFNPEQEIHLFTRGLEDAAKGLGPKHPFILAVLGGKSPADVAKTAVEGTKLRDAAFRKTLLEGGRKAIAESTDPMLVLARRIEPLSLALRKKQDAVQAVISEHGARIAKARFAVFGKEKYPDATGSLRLSFGSVATYPANGTLVQPFTTFLGLYDRHEGWGGNAAKSHSGAWMLPQRWLDAKSKLKLDTPFNFITNNDIIGGNSGSPVLNAKGELVGLVFDGNIESNAGRYFFDPKVNRAVSVDLRAIVEALDKVMDAPHLVKELTGR